ncbi:MAG: hypothetical protein WBI26_08050 [Syntrophomonadaceae bacterium]|jgi:hypothetical protein
MLFFWSAVPGDEEASNSQYDLERNGQKVSFKELSFNSWDVEEIVAQIGEQEHKPYTIRLYLNGPDLET